MSLDQAEDMACLSLARFPVVQTAFAIDPIAGWPVSFG